ncbi:MAG: FAD-dependent oxidoreductase [Patescibacteria group bacterium]
MKDNENYDVIIVGGGPAGLTAAVYALRRELKTLVIVKGLGGQAALADEVQNWPGTISTTGYELAQSFQKQAEKWGVEFDFNEVVKLEKSGDDFLVKTNTDEYKTAAVILAFGLTPSDLGVKGEEQFKGRGVSYCATCDGPLYKNKKVVVVGGGNSALEAVEYLSRLAERVYLVNNTDRLMADSVLIQQAKTKGNLELFCSHEVVEIKGDKKVSGVLIVDVNNKKEQQELAVDGIFVEVGHKPKTDWLKGTIDLNQRGEVIIDKENQTTLAGVFAAGDCTDVDYKQIVIAAGEGAKAALSAYKYVAGKAGRPIKPDWGKC